MVSMVRMVRKKSEVSVVTGVEGGSATKETHCFGALSEGAPS
jgi:hypothetical protein